MSEGKPQYHNARLVEMMDVNIIDSVTVLYEVLSQRPFLIKQLEKLKSLRITRLICMSGINIL